MTLAMHESYANGGARSGARRDALENRKRKGKGIMCISPSYPPYTARRSCLANFFLKTVSTSSQNLLHQHSCKRSYHNHSWSPAKRTLKCCCVQKRKKGGSNTYIKKYISIKRKNKLYNFHVHINIFRASSKDPKLF
jgi:hypothetical protein